MRKSRFSADQIVAILEEGAEGRPVAEIVRRHGISPATYFAWKVKFGGLSADEIVRLRKLEAASAEFRRM